MRATQGAPAPMPVFRLSLLGLALTLAWQTPGRAGDMSDDELPQLTEVVVSATRTDTPLDQVPAAVSVVGRERFEALPNASVGQVMRQLPGVEFGGSPRPSGQIPSIRGFYGKDMTLLLDGARLNEASVASPLYLDSYLVQRAEVVRGPTSSLYGSGGLGGVMSFRTVSALDLLAPGQDFGGDARVGYASADLSQHYNARLYGRQDGVDGLLALGRAEWGHIRQGGGDYLEPNDGTADNGLLKFGWQASDQLRFDASHQFYREDSRRPNNPQSDLALGTPSSVPVQRNHIKQDTSVLKGSYSDVDGAPLFDASVYQTRLRRSADATSALPATESQLDTDGLSLQHTLRWGDAASVQQRLSYGLDYYKDHQWAKSAGAANPVLPDGTQKVAGIYVQDEITFAEDWRLIPSLRADRFDTDADGADSSLDSHVSPKLAIAWQFKPQLGFYLSYGEAFRAPSLSEMYQNLSRNNALYNFRPNPDLEPQTDRTLEFGANYHQEALLSSDDRLRLRAALFHSKVSDLISSTVVGSYARSYPFSGRGLIFQYQNVADATRNGAELEAHYQRGPLALALGYSRVRIEDADSGENLFSPPDKLSWQLDYRFADPQLTLHWNALFVAAQDYDDTELRRRAGYAVHDLMLSWQAHRQLRVDFGISNLFDKRYSVYQSSSATADILEAGRSVNVALSVDF